VLIALPDGIDFVRALLGTLWAGAVAVPVNPSLPTKDLVTLLHRAGPSVAIGGPALASAASQTGTHVLAPGQLTARQSPPDVTERAPQDDAYALFTSGTTGEPKLCFHAHADPLVHDQAFGKPVLNLRPGRVTMSVSKCFFSYGLGNSVWYPLLNGATAVLEPAPPAEATVLAAIRRYDIDTTYAVPSVYARLLAHPDAGALKVVRLAVCAGEVLPSTVAEKMAALDGPILLNGIGSTEAGQTFASNSAAARRPGTVGQVLPPYRIRIVDDAGAAVPAGTEGELLVQGPTVSPGSPSARERQPRRPGGWHPTGDAATLDTDGFLRIAGRIDDLEIVAGVNVHPAEIEELLRKHPRVTDVAVCAVTDEQGVSRLTAYVVCDQPGNPGEIIAALRGKVAAEKVPRAVVFVPGLPRTFTGKLRRRALRQAAAAYQATGSWPD
jgi:acyl-coenzyme A synthetase/AMP-(fatty) acid ligase